MERKTVIDLTNLVQKHSTEIARMLSAINGEPDCALWTSELRTAVRGGKPLGGPRIEDLPDDAQSG